MEVTRFDQVAREIGADTPRRGLLGWLIAFLLSGRFLWFNQETAEAGRRRKRRKKRHKHGRPRPHGKRKHRNRLRRKHNKHDAACRPGEPCGAPGQICQSDGSCACTATSCPECQACHAVSGLCVPNPGAAGDPCGEPIQVCQSDGTCGCPGTGCGGVCGCASGFVCDEGTCRQQCDVTFNGDSVASGAALHGALDLGNMVRVCPGRYQHNFELSTDVTVIGAGDGEDAASSTILDAGGSGRTLFVSQGVKASLRGVRISGGDADLGGGFRSDGGLTLTSCTITGNSANLGGGLYAPFNATGALALIDCQVLENDANRGAGLDNNSIVTVTISGCTIAKNQSAEDGGGIFNNGGTIAITGSEITTNEAKGNGGGAFNNTPVMVNPGEVTFDAASRVQNNKAGTNGGGIFNEGEITLNGATVTGNTPNNCAGDPVDACSEAP